MLADPINLHIYLMGMVMLVSGSGGKDLAILMPQIDGHYPVVVYPCIDKKTCAGNAKDVWAELDLWDKNFVGDLLNFKGESFGALQFEGRKIGFKKPLEPARWTAVHSMPSHPWYTRWWFHMKGEVPSSQVESVDSAWAPSLSEVAGDCARLTPCDGETQFMQKRLAGFMRLTLKDVAPVAAKSEASMTEYDVGMCNGPASGSDQPHSYAPTVRFGPTMWPFGDPNQATAEIVEIDLRTERAPEITLETSDGAAISVPLPPSNDLDILIGNLVKVSKEPIPCPPNLKHFIEYQNLLPHGCNLREPHVGWLSTRVKKEDIGQGNFTMPSVIKAVSLDSSAEPFITETILQGLSRPICFVARN